MTKGYRSPFRRRADGEMKLMHHDRAFEASGIPATARWLGVELAGDPGLPPALHSADRTNSNRRRAGSRRTKRGNR